MDLMINMSIAGMVFIGALGIGLVGMALLHLLPSSIKQKIERFHEDN